jgi:hypothetical protein
MNSYQYLQIIYSNMRQRCLHKKHPDYKYYGARGIKICRRWKGPRGCLTFCLDVLSSLGPRPEGRLPGGRSAWCIDRIDGNGNYEITNLRWAPLDVSLHNKRPSRGRKKADYSDMLTNSSAQITGCDSLEVIT